MAEVAAARRLWMRREEDGEKERKRERNGLSLAFLRGYFSKYEKRKKVKKIIALFLPHIVTHKCTEFQGFGSTSAF